MEIKKFSDYEELIMDFYSDFDEEELVLNINIAYGDLCSSIKNSSSVSISDLGKFLRSMIGYMSTERGDNLEYKSVLYHDNIKEYYRFIMNTRDKEELNRSNKELVLELSKYMGIFFDSTYSYLYLSNIMPIICMICNNIEKTLYRVLKSDINQFCEVPQR